LDHFSESLFLDDGVCEGEDGILLTIGEAGDLLETPQELGVEL
jgi:hypothetical protein